MWRGASSSTQIRERHTWQFDFDSSNSFSVFVICSLKYVELKEKCVCFVLFLFFAFVPACLARHFSGALCCFFFLLFFSCCSLFHLASDLARFSVQFCSCFTVHTPHPPPPHRRTLIHTFPQTDTAPSHSKQINSSLAVLGTPQWNAAAHSSPENVRAVANVPRPRRLEEAILLGLRVFPSACMCGCRRWKQTVVDLR